MIEGEDGEEEITKKEKEVLINFLDFNECDGTSSYRLSRPILSAERKESYESQSHSSMALQEMHRFYESGRFSDIVVCTENLRIPCHKLVLAASSLYFDRMFSGNTAESYVGEVVLKNISGPALKRLIEHTYTSKLVIDSEVALEMFETSDMLQFVELRAFCEDFLLGEITASNCLSFVTYADVFSSKALYDHSINIAADNFGTIRQHKDFLDLPYEHIHRLLEGDNVDTEYEEFVYEAFKQWISVDLENRKEHLIDLFQSIRLNFVSRWYLISVISTDPLITQSPQCTAVVQRAKDQLLAFGHTYELSWQLPPSRKNTGLTWKLIYINTYDPHPDESEVYLFDPVNKSWSSTSQACPLASELSTSCSFGSSLLIIGGWTDKSGTKSMNMKGAVDVLHEFRVMSIFPTLWYVGSHNMGIYRYLHSTVATAEGVMLLGGFDEGHKLQATVFEGRSSCNFKMEACPRMLYPVFSPACCLYADKLYAFGGYLYNCTGLCALQVYHLTQKFWSEVKLQSEEGVVCVDVMSCHYACEVDEDLFIVLGQTLSCQSRERSNCTPIVPVKRVDGVGRFCPRRNLFVQFHNIPESRQGAFSITNISSRLYITGGTRKGQKVSQIECFDMRDGVWTEVGTAKDGKGSLSLASSLRVMHENFGL